MAHHFLRAAATALALTIGACATAQVSDYATDQFGTPPAVPTAPFDPSTEVAIQTAFIDSIAERQWLPGHTEALQTLTETNDPRIAWMISDMMRFVPEAQLQFILGAAAASLLGIDPPDRNGWGVITDHLIAWDIPAPPNYLDVKRGIFTGIIPGWERIFVEGDVDWRHVSWGGVLIDDRAYDTTDERCNCIPAADNPAVTSAQDADWLEDDDIVFGIEVNGAYRAYPRQIMEVREMVNDTLGGRDLGIPYCTLCGAAQAFFTDGLPEGVERPILRTSGLLSRSNKVMYDLTSWSVFDTFLGTALTGPLAEKGITLEQATVVTTEWGAWKKAHPETTVLAEYLALGRDPDFRNSRDAQGPIFPIGDVDPRLPVQEDIIGVLTASGTPVAFQRTAALLSLRAGKEVRFEDIRLELDAGGIRAIGSDGADKGSHEAFWFAWSQFYPGTALWSG